MWIHSVINIQHRPHQLQAHCKLLIIIARHYGILVIHYKNFNCFTNSICLCVCEHIGYQTITSTNDHQFTPYFACRWGMWLVRWLLFLRQAWSRFRILELWKFWCRQFQIVITFFQGLSQTANRAEINEHCLSKINQLWLRTQWSRKPETEFRF